LLRIFSAEEGVSYIANGYTNGTDPKKIKDFVHDPVCGKKYTWKEGEDVPFGDTFTHEVWKKVPAAGWCFFATFTAKSACRDGCSFSTGKFSTCCRNPPT